MTRCHLIDASPYIFRGYFSLPKSIVDPQGRPVNAVHGWAGFMLRLLAEEQPTHLGVAFDGSLTTSFRNEIYPEYKAQRELPPAELEAQLDDCVDLAQALGAQTFIDQRFEADDLIGTLASSLRARDRGVVVVSSDKDLAQLVDERTELFDFAKGERYGPAEVRDKFGVEPRQIADYLALAGDSVDNIPGVRGVGAKSAVALLSKFSSVEDLYDRVVEVEELKVRGARSLRRRLEADRDSAFLSKRLATLSTEAPLSSSLGDLEYSGASRARIALLSDRLGFASLPGRVERWCD